MKNTNYRVRMVIERPSVSKHGWVEVSPEVMNPGWTLNSMKKDLKTLSTADALDSPLVAAYVNILYQYFVEAGLLIPQED